MKSIPRTTLLSTLLLATALPSPARAQDEERRNAIVRAVGEQPADTLFTVHEAVNALAEGWAGETFEADRAAELASSYQESADLGRAKQWKPSAEALAAIAAAPEEAEVLAAYADTVFGQIPSGQPGSKPSQTEILVQGPGMEELPGGYSQNIGHFKPGMKFYGFKYVEPGETLGMSYNGIFQVEGKWYFLPKAWRAFDAVQPPE